MDFLKTVGGEAFHCICNFQLWRMAFLWTFSLLFSYFKLFLPQSKRYSRCSPKDSASNSAAVPKPVCILTGATSGLGAAAACDLSKEGFYVVLVGRSSELLSKAVSNIKKQNSEASLKAFEVDLSSIKSILEFSHSLQQWLRDSNMHSSVQLLINNAGILATSHRLTSEGYDQMLATNYFGAFCLTKVLLPLLENSPVSSRVVNVTSFTHRNVSCMQVDRETVTGKCFIKSKCYPYAQAYECSKLCMLLFSYELHRQFPLMEKSHHISVVAADPGAVKTNIMREIPSCISQMAYTGLKLLCLLQSSETGVRSISDAALAPPGRLILPHARVFLVHYQSNCLTDCSPDYACGYGGADRSAIQANEYVSRSCFLCFQQLLPKEPYFHELCFWRDSPAATAYCHRSKPRQLSLCITLCINAFNNSRNPNFTEPIGFVTQSLNP